MTKTIAGRQYIHSCHVTNIPPHNTDAVVVKEYIHYTDGSTEPVLTTINKPKRSFYITKPNIRQMHDEKREWEHVDNLDRYICYNYQMPEKIFQALNGYYPKQKVNLRKLFDSPYIYGADICIESIISRKYYDAFEATGLPPVTLKIGMYDIESDVDPSSPTYGDINVASITCENVIYVSTLKSFIANAEYKTEDELRDYIKSNLLEHLNGNSTAKDVLGDMDIVVHVHYADSVPDLLHWLFNHAHANKMDFLGGWNSKYDINETIKQCIKFGVDPLDIFCDPSIDKKYRYFDFYEDTTDIKKAGHFTRRWNHMSCTAHFQVYDAQQLYSRSRIIDGYESSYKLEDILTKHIGIGKMHFSQLDDLGKLSELEWHRAMQKKYPYEYICYNCFDTFGLRLFEYKNQDDEGLYVLLEHSHIKNFAKQTRRIMDTLFIKCSNYNKVMGVTGSDMTGKYDHLIPKVGGAVLSPKRANRVGVNVIKELPNQETLAMLYCSDIDYTGFYPNVSQMANVSKETKLSTLINIEGFNALDSQEFTSLIISIDENAVQIGTTFFDLPDYTELEDMLVARLNIAT